MWRRGNIIFLVRKNLFKSFHKLAARLLGFLGVIGFFVGFGAVRVGVLGVRG